MPRLQSIQAANLGQVEARTSVTAFGHADDHFQLVATIASRLDPSLASDEARACTSPKSSWKERRDALVGLGMRSGGELDVVDVDALDVGVEKEGERWADLQLREDRALFLAELVLLAARTGWRLVRPAPTLKTSDLLRSVGAEYLNASAPDPLDTLDDPLLRVGLQAVAPEVRGVASWLLGESLVDPPSLRRLLEEEGEERATQLVIGVAYDVLPRGVRETALALAAIREEVPINVIIGPFDQRDRPAIDLDARHVPRRHVAKLLRCGFLQSRGLGENRVVRMPRSVRQFLEPRAWTRSATSAKKAHGIMVGEAGDQVEAVVARHWHAVCAGDTAAALETAKFYVSDLRILAYRLSKEERAYATAADLYQRVVDADDQDAYAWEYLGYNLARAAGRTQCSPPHRPRIEEALRRATDLDPTNPLYRGRLLGYLGRCGEDITDAFGKGISEFAGRYRGPGVTWFAEPVLRELGSGRAPKHLGTIRGQWGEFLGRYDRLRPLLAS